MTNHPRTAEVALQDDTRVHVGVDIGSISCKVAVLDASRRVITARYVRHRGNVSCERYAAWEESKHPRGQPENPGQFAETEGGVKQAPQAPVAAPGPAAMVPAQQTEHFPAPGRWQLVENRLERRLRQQPQQ